MTKSAQFTPEDLLVRHVGSFPPEMNAALASMADEVQAIVNKARATHREAAKSLRPEAMRGARQKIAVEAQAMFLNLSRLQVVVSTHASVARLESELATKLGPTFNPSDNPREIALRAELRGKLERMDPLMRNQLVREAGVTANLPTLAAVGEISGTPFRIVSDVTLQEARDLAARVMSPDLAAAHEEARMGLSYLTGTIETGRRLIGKELGLSDSDALVGEV